MKKWPKNWPVYSSEQMEDACDTLVGLCCCGENHIPGEFELIGDQLFRRGKRVQSRPIKYQIDYSQRMSPDFDVRLKKMRCEIERLRFSEKKGIFSE